MSVSPDMLCFNDEVEAKEIESSCSRPINPLKNPELFCRSVVAAFHPMQDMKNA